MIDKINIWLRVSEFPVEGEGAGRWHSAVPWRGGIGRCGDPQQRLRVLCPARNPAAAVANFTPINQAGNAGAHLPLSPSLALSTQHRHRPGPVGPTHPAGHPHRRPRRPRPRRRFLHGRFRSDSLVPCPLIMQIHRYQRIQPTKPTKKEEKSVGRWRHRCSFLDSSAEGRAQTRRWRTRDGDPHSGGRLERHTVYDVEGRDAAPSGR